ncbi:MAG: hypothetical protein LBG75_00700 [Candidatus Nomurabacteria bacterium]|jgi:hypothetical protein|nr:hypothetical protein [Candidatus Nomurabacteria bacterium]
MAEILGNKSELIIQAVDAAAEYAESKNKVSYETMKDLAKAACDLCKFQEECAAPGYLYRSLELPGNINVDSGKGKNANLKAYNQLCLKGKAPDKLCKEVVDKPPLLRSDVEQNMPNDNILAASGKTYAMVFKENFHKDADKFNIIEDV